MKNDVRAILLNKNRVRVMVIVLTLSSNEETSDFWASGKIYAYDSLSLEQGTLEQNVVKMRFHFCGLRFPASMRKARFYWDNIRIAFGRVPGA